MVAFPNAKAQTIQELGPKHRSDELPFAIQPVPGNLDLWKHQETFCARALGQRMGQLHQCHPNYAQSSYSDFDLDEAMADLGIDAEVRVLLF
jgi:hypothetical protein